MLISAPTIPPPSHKINHPTGVFAIIPQFSRQLFAKKKPLIENALLYIFQPPTLIVIVLIPLVILSVTEWIPNRKEEKEHKALVNRLYSIEEQIGIELEAQNYEKALFYANQLYSDSYKDQKIWNSKRESYISMIENAQKQQALSNPSIVFAPASSDNLVGKNYNEIVDYLSSAGFTFISTQKSLEKASESQPENTVERVLIGGKTTFTTEDYFDKDIPVIIYYYSN